MKQKMIVSAAALIGLVCNSPMTGAVELAGKAFEVYGKLELSLDYSDTDEPGRSADFSLSSNSTRLGFRGEHEIDSNYTLVWQIEQELLVDQGAGLWATRNTYAGFQTAKYGRLIFGYYDTPFKTVGTQWDVMYDTVAERRALLGASAVDGDELNRRARNAILYSYKPKPVIELQAMYSTDGQNVSASNPPDDNSYDMLSVGAFYEDGPMALAAAYEHWDNFDGPSGAYGTINAIRVAGNQKVGNGRIGIIFENISADSANHIDRSAFGLNGELYRGAFTYKAQLLFADDYAGQSNSGATRIGLAVFDKLDKQTDVYAALGVTANDNNAQYKGVDGEHGDKVPTVLGGTPSAISAGFQYYF
jgi:predicted porin